MCRVGRLGAGSAHDDRPRSAARRAVVAVMRGIPRRLSGRVSRLEINELVSKSRCGGGGGDAMKLAYVHPGDWSSSTRVGRRMIARVVEVRDGVPRFEPL